jgi:DNA-binding transcriptional LysR family regulator
MLTQYDYFLAVIDHGGIRAAAAALGVSQPAVTRGLQSLEKELGALLFERGRNRMELSRHGRMVLPRVRSLLAEHHRILSDLAHARGIGADGRAVITASPLSMLSFAPRIVARAQREPAALELVLRGECAGTRDGALHALLAGDADAALAAHSAAALDEALEAVPLLQPVLRVVARAAEREEGEPRDPSAACWVLPPRGSVQGDLIRGLFTSGELCSTKPPVEVEGWSAILAIVRSTDCLTVLPYHPAHLRDELRGLTLLDHTLSARPDPVSIITRRAARAQPVTQLLVHLAREVAQDELPS